MTRIETASVANIDYAQMSVTKPAVTVLMGDGIGPEVVSAAMRVVEAAGVAIDWQPCVAGAQAFNQGITTGVPEATIASIAKTKIVLKGPLETPIGFGGKSANVTLRKMFETFANIRPVKELPGIASPFAGRGIDMVIVRENVEDLYAGIEHMQTPGVAQALKIVSAMGSEKISHVAFALAQAEGRKTVHCATKANILKMTEGMMKRSFEKVAASYPSVTAKHMIVDNCAHQLVMNPEQFDVIVMTNMNGDILSDLAAGLVGGLGIAPSANIGHDVAMFEAVHGSAPDIAGQGKANPTAMILSAVMMLRHLGRFAEATAIEQAVKVTLAEGKALTGDLAKKGQAASTTEFTNAIIANLGRTHDTTSARAYKPLAVPPRATSPIAVTPAKREVIGVDIFIESGDAATDIGPALEAAANATGFKLKMISNRGTQVFPVAGGNSDTVDVWRCRFVKSADVGQASNAQIAALVREVSCVYSWMHIEKLQRFDGALGYTLAQGEAA